MSQLLIERALPALSINYSPMRDSKTLGISYEPRGLFTGQLTTIGSSGNGNLIHPQILSSFYDIRKLAREVFTYRLE
jgi:hypothetical protein